MPRHYRAIRLERFAPTFREAADIATLPLEAPRAGELSVRNHWCGINGIFDTQIARNAVDYITIPLPSMTGVEAIGMVEAVGAGVTDFAIGDAVLTTRFSGGYRERNIGPAAHFVAVPDTRPEWMVLGSTGVSAWLALERIGQVADGETVAISAAAGGLGHLMVQLAKRRGCRVVAVCGGADKAEFLRTLGADRTIDYRTESVAAVLAAEFKDAIDVALDSVSGTIFDAFADNLAPAGRLVVCGAASDLDGKPEIVTAPRIGTKLYYKGASVRGFMNGRLSAHWPEARARMFDLFAAGEIRPAMDGVPFRGLDSIYDAVERLSSGASIGKVVVDLRP
jgi:NADPH-dependent curcumin reductase CurA